MTQTKTTDSPDLGRASRANIYFEPELYALIQAIAEKKGKSVSTHVRGIVLQDLLEQGLIPGDMIARLLKVA